MITQKNLLLLIFCLFLGMFWLAACGGEESAEEQSQPQLKVEELETELANKEEQINQLQQEVADVQSRIPKSFETQAGDTHWGIAYDFLTQNKGLPEQEARGILANTILVHPILVGYKVWNYFHEGVYGTFVTQAEGRIAPGALKRIEKKEVKDEKTELQSQIVQLKNQNEELTEKIQSLEKEQQAMNQKFQNQIASLNQKVESSQQQNSQLNSMINSVYYLAGSKDNLESSGKIKGTFLGLGGMDIGEVSSSDFEKRVDLSQTDIIELDAANLNVNKIKKVELLPDHLEENKDYRIQVAADQQSASIRLLDKDKFRLARIILFVN